MKMEKLINFLEVEFPEDFKAAMNQPTEQMSQEFPSEHNAEEQFYMILDELSLKILNKLKNKPVELVEPEVKKEEEPKKEEIKLMKWIASVLYKEKSGKQNIFNFDIQSTNKEEADLIAKEKANKQLSKETILEIKLRCVGYVE